MPKGVHIVFIYVTVMLQSGEKGEKNLVIKESTFMTKTKAKTWDAKLAKMTKWVALGFVLLTLGLNLFA